MYYLGSPCLYLDVFIEVLNKYCFSHLIIYILYVCAYSYICIYIYIYVRVCVCVCMCVRTCMCMYTHIYVAKFPFTASM